MNELQKRGRWYSFLCCHILSQPGDKLDLKSSALFDEDIPELAQFLCQSKPLLSSLWLDHNSISDVSEILKLPSLRYLSLSRTDVQNIGIFFDSSLLQVHFGHSQISQLDFQHARTASAARLEKQVTAFFPRSLAGLITEYAIRNISFEKDQLSMESLDHFLLC